MADYDLIVRGGTVVTASDQFRADVGMRGGRIAALADRLDGGPALDAGGLLVLPGGVDSHCHIEQLQDGGGADEETFATGSTAALAGGTTSVVTFSTQFKGGGVLEPLAEYQRRAAAGAMVDYAFHQIVTDPTEAVIREELPQLVASRRAQPQGVPDLRSAAAGRPAIPRRAGGGAAARLPGDGALRELRRDRLALGRAARGRAHGAEIPRLVAPGGGRAGGDAPRHRAGRAGGHADRGVPRLLPGGGGGDRPRAGARRAGVGRDLPAVFRAERGRHGPPGVRGRQVHVQPGPARRRRHGRAVGGDPPRTLEVVSSDHSGWSYDGPRGKRSNGADAPFTEIPNGVPGLAARLPLLWSEGVATGRITRQRLRPADRHAAGPAVRPARQGPDRTGRRRRPGAVGPGAAHHAHQRADAARDRLHAVRGAGGDRLAGRDDPARRGGHARRRGAGRTRQRPLPARRRPTTSSGTARRLADGFDAAAFC